MQCNWPGCTHEGEFRAPKSPREPRTWQYFCKEHIKEFNKSWNGLKGFSQDEIFSMQNGGATWQRPTWGMGVNGAKLSQEADSGFSSAQDLYGLFQKRLKSEQRQAAAQATTAHLPPDVKEACAIFSLPLPERSADVLKKRYHALVKQHHPDVNTSPDAPEHIKRINVAYRILADYSQRHP